MMRGGGKMDAGKGGGSVKVSRGEECHKHYRSFISHSLAPTGEVEEGGGEKLCPGGGAGQGE